MLKQPSSVVKMTNVATIRYNINKRTFEIACYPSKVANWRSGVEQDITEVLQIAEIYENASHGTIAKKADLNKYFPSRTKLEIIEIILERGELQVSEKQREVQQSGLLADIIKIIVEKCVHPITKRRFTPETIRQAIRDIHFPIKSEQTAKKQALDCIKALQKVYQIARGEMKVRITFDETDTQKIEQNLKKIEINEFTEESKGNVCSRVYNIEPSKYRSVLEIKHIPNVSVEVLVGVVVNSEYHGLQQEQFSVLELISGAKAEKDKEEQEEPVPLKPKVESNEKVLHCTNCGETATFGTASEQRLHFKLQWHVENVKRRGKGLPPLSEQEHKIEQFNQNYK